jgi:hypothetical protein
MPCLQVLLMIGVAILNSVAAHIQEWPMAYQYINIPHFLMYIAIIYYLCKNEFYSTAWVVFAIITLVTVDFMILSKKIFAIEDTLMARLKGSASSSSCSCAASSSSCSCAASSTSCPCASRSKPCHCVGRSTPCNCGGNSCKCGCTGSTTPQPPPTTLQPQASQPLSQFTSQPSSTLRLEPGQEIGSFLEAAGYGNPPLNVMMQPPPVNSATVMVKS